VQAVEVCAPQVDYSQAADGRYNVIADQSAVALESSPLSLLGNMLGKKPIRHVAEGGDGTSGAALGCHVDPLFYPAQQLSGLNASFVRRHAAMRPDLHAPRPPILSELRHVHLGTAREGSNAKPSYGIIPQDASILAGLAAVRINGAFGDSASCHGKAHR
jgi:hypothetical protein